MVGINSLKLVNAGMHVLYILLALYDGRAVVILVLCDLPRTLFHLKRPHRGGMVVIWGDSGMRSHNSVLHLAKNLEILDDYVHWQIVWIVPVECWLLIRTNDEGDPIRILFLYLIRESLFKLLTLRVDQSIYFDTPAGSVQRVPL